MTVNIQLTLIKLAKLDLVWSVADSSSLEGVYGDPTFRSHKSLRLFVSSKC